MVDFPASPATIRLPIAFNPAMAHTMLRALPAPDAHQPLLGRYRIADVFEIVRMMDPRTAVEAMLVLQMVCATLRAPQSHAVATRHEHNPAVMMRWERLSLAQSRMASSLHDRLLRQRRVNGTVPTDESTRWTCSLDEMEAMWRQAHAAPPSAPAEVAAAPGIEAPGIEVPGTEAPVVRETVTSAAAREAVRLPEAAAPLPRWQRRALEKQARKQAARAADAVRQAGHAVA